MIQPGQIVFHGMGPSEFIEDSLKNHIRHIEKHYTDILSWHITVSAPHKCHRNGNNYELNIRASVPGEEIVVSHMRSDKHDYNDMRALIRDAFIAFESQLEKRKGKKQHSHRTALNAQSIDD